MVRLARRWKTVPVQHICNITAQIFEKYDQNNLLILFSWEYNVSYLHLL